MKLRTVVAIPLAVGLASLAVNGLLSGTGGYSDFLKIETEALKAIACVGSLLAALAFGRGEYMRWAWLFTSGCMLFLLLHDLTQSPFFSGTTLGSDAFGCTLAVTANLSLIVGMFMLSQAWRRTGLGLPGSPWMQLALYLGAAGLALLIVGPAVASDFVRVLGGDAEAFVSLVSGVADAISLCLIAPLLLTALALQGGLLSWPWWLLTWSMIAWLCFDAMYEYGSWLGLNDDQAQVCRELFRVLGCLYEFLSGMAQRHVVLRARRKHPMIR